MRRIRLLATMAALATLTTEPFLAHHSMGMYDQTTLITIRGTITQVVWRNPHSWIELSVTMDKGTTSTQRVEMGGPSRFLQSGFDRSFVAVGDSVSFEAWLPKDPNSGSAPAGRMITLADGRRFDVGDNWMQARPAEPR